MIKANDIEMVKLGGMTPEERERYEKNKIEINKKVSSLIAEATKNAKLEAIHVSVFPLKSTSAILLFIEDGVKRYRKFYRSLRKLPNDDQLAAINYLVFSYTENVFMNPTTHKELRKNDLFMDMCRKSTDFRSHTPFPLDDPLEAAVKEFSLSKRNEIPNLLSREYALN